MFQENRIFRAGAIGATRQDVEGRDHDCRYEESADQRLFLHIYPVPCHLVLQAVIMRCQKWCEPWLGLIGAGAGYPRLRTDTHSQLRNRQPMKCRIPAGRCAIPAPIMVSLRRSPISMPTGCHEAAKTCATSPSICNASPSSPTCPSMKPSPIFSCH